MSRASEYRKRLYEDITAPSGAVFTLRPPRLQSFLQNGRLPQSLLTHGMNAWREHGKIDEDTFRDHVMQELSEADMTGMIIFMRDIVVDACVSPRIVPRDNWDDIKDRQFALDDLNRLLAELLDSDDSDPLRRMQINALENEKREVEKWLAPYENELDPDDVKDEDLFFIFQWAMEKNKETKALKFFRNGFGESTAFNSTNGAADADKREPTFAN